MSEKKFTDLSIKEQDQMLARFDAVKKREEREKEYPAYKYSQKAHAALEDFLSTPKKDVPLTEEEAQKLRDAYKILDGWMKKIEEK